MSIERLTYVNERGESIVFSRASPFHVNFKDVTGLPDLRAEVYRVTSMGQDGDTFVANRITSRDIEIVGHINERGRERVMARRRELTHVLNPHYSATLTYEFGSFKRVIGCRAEGAPLDRNEPIFDRFAVQLVCLHPYWREEQTTRADIAGWEGMIEFPEDILELSEDEFEMERRLPAIIANALNGGDVTTGMRVEFRAMGTLTNPSLLNVVTGEFIRMHSLSMVAGDVLTVSTGYGEKKVTLLRGGQTINAFRYLDPDSTYMQLATGDNLLRYDAETNVENLEVIVHYDNLYLGV